jgi:uncharacterized RDD family membrane protein YckC
MARWIDQWMPGSTPAADGEPTGGYPGERFGLPREGPGSAVGFGRRLAALTIDWFVSYLIAGLFAGPDALGEPSFGFIILGVWFLLTAVPIAVFGATTGMTALGIRVASIGSEAIIGVPRALLRTLLVTLVLPPLLRDADGRGLHDRATRTIVVRTRA